MPPKQIYWITSEKYPKGYVHELPVHELLRARGMKVIPLIWSRDPIPHLMAGDHVIVRTTWDYLEKFDAFSTWLADLPKTRVHNSGNLLRWNAEKTYLSELERTGVRLVPTVWIKESSEAEIANAVRAAFPGRPKILKPVRSAGSHDTYRIGADETPPTEIFRNRPAMIQPYLEEIEKEGERSLIFFGGKLSHGVQKLPKAGDFRVQESHGGRMSAFEVSAVEKVFGDHVISAILKRFPEEPPPLYARIDYVRVAEVPHLMEAELLEPDLYFHHSPGSAERFVERVGALSD